MPGHVVFDTRVTGLQAADVDGDGRRDLVFATGNLVSTLYRGLDGGFSWGADVPLDGAVGPFVVQDLNGDGRLDLVATNGSVLQVLVGTHDGGFKLGQRTSERHFGFGLGHFDSDRFPDLVVAYQSFFSVLRNDGDAGFVERLRLDAGTPAFGIAVQDVDADGRSDLLLPRASGAMELLYGAFDGGFSPGPDLAHGTLADFNGDGFLDIYGMERDGAGVSQFVFALNQGGRSFGAWQAVRTLPGARLHVGDVTGDGRPDVVAATDVEGLAVHVNDGAGRFHTLGPFFSQSVEHPAIGDWNGDGVLDVAVVVASGYGIAVLPGLGDGRLVSPTRYEDRGRGWPALLRDYDGDGVLDLVWATSRSTSSGGEVGVLRNDGSGVFTELAANRVFSDVSSLAGFDVIEARAGNRPSIVAVDGRGVLLVRAATDGGFLPAERLHDGGTLAKGPVVADFDGDGRRDLAWADGEFLRVSLNRDGGFGVPLESRVSGAFILGYVAGRVDADASPDLLVERDDFASRTWTLERGNGDGTFSVSWAWDAGVSLGSPTLMAPGDYDGDGLTDVWAVQSDSTAWLLRADGAGGVAPVRLGQGAMGIVSAEAFRWPGAQRDSLAIRSSIPSSVGDPGRSILMFGEVTDAGMSLVRHRFVVSGGLWSAPRFGDLDRDGRLDFVLGDNVTRGVFLNVCGP